MTTLILVRHGQSEANLNEIYTGQTDIALTELGQSQAEATSEYVVSNYKVDKIYASDLQRAYNTAKPASEMLGLEIIPSKGMREIDGGDWEKCTYEALQENYPEEYSTWLSDPGNAGCVGGESVKQLMERVMAELAKIAEENDGKTVLVATHATPIRVFLTMSLHGTLDEMKNVPWVANSSVTVAEYENGKFNLTVIGENSYLKELRTEFPSGKV